MIPTQTTLHSSSLKGEYLGIHSLFIFKVLYNHFHSQVVQNPNPKDQKPIMADDNVQKQILMLEFLLRQPVEDKLLSRLILALPHPISDHRLIKTLLIRRISNQIEKCMISEHILESLQLIEEIDHQNGITPLDSLKNAYCAVAMDCVVRFLREGPKNWDEYSNAVDRVWSRVRFGPISEWIKGLMTVLEEAAHYLSVCDSILMTDTEKDALEAVGKFLVEVNEDMGSSVLEMAAEKISDGVNGIVDQVLISNPGLTPVNKKVRRAPESSLSDLNGVVKNPLSDHASCMAASISASIAKKVEMDRCDDTVDKECDGFQGKEGNMRSKAAVAASRLSIMERNNTAQTFEWDDEIASTSERCPDHPHLPSRRSRIVTPLRKQEIGNVTGRRQKKRWNQLEEQTLRVAVNEFGRGNWKIILDDYRHIFEGRTTGDLKDKWRNMTR